MKGSTAGADSVGIAQVLATYAGAALVGGVLAAVAQPERTDLLFAGVLLFTVGLGFGRYALEVIVLPFVVVAWLWRRVTGGSTSQSKGSTWDEKLAKLVFVLTYAFITAVGGGVICAFAGGWGVFAGVVAFGGTGLVLSVLVRNVVLHHLGTDEPAVAEPAPFHRNDDPAPEVVTRIAQRLADELKRK